MANNAPIYQAYGEYLQRDFQRAENVPGYFNSATLYRLPRQKYLLYVPGFCAFVFMFVIGTLVSLLLWQEAGLQSGFQYNQFYILLRPTQILSAVFLVAVFWVSTLIMNMVSRVAVEENHEVLKLLVMLGADNQYIIDGFHRAIFKHSMRSICIGAAGGVALLWGFRLYLLWFFSTIHNVLPKIGGIDYWFAMLWVVTVCIYGVLILFNNSYVTLKRLAILSSSDSVQ